MSMWRLVTYLRTGIIVLSRLAVPLLSKPHLLLLSADCSYINNKASNRSLPSFVLAASRGVLFARAGILISNQSCQCWVAIWLIILFYTINTHRNLLPKPTSKVSSLVCSWSIMPVVKLIIKNIVSMGLFGLHLVMKILHSASHN